MKDDGGAAAKLACRRVRTRADGSRHVAQLFFAVARDETERIRLAARRPDDDGRRRETFPPRFRNARQLALEPLAETGVVRLVGHDDVDAPERAEPADEIEIRRPQPARVRGISATATIA